LDFRAVLTEDELEAWGVRIGASAPRPLVVALSGDLGAGKTTLARAIVRGAAGGESVPSPTFNLLFRYDSPGGPVLHFDLYRLEDAEEVWELGWDEIGGPGELVLVEWPERAAALMPVPRWEIRIGDAEDADRRIVEGTPVGAPGRIPEPNEVSP
jgi:tRNA threonylcarbamoyladenosine biosynthesis protein TsaE